MGSPYSAVYGRRRRLPEAPPYYPEQDFAPLTPEEELAFRPVEAFGRGYRSPTGLTAPPLLPPNPLDFRQPPVDADSALALTGSPLDYGDRGATPSLVRAPVVRNPLAVEAEQASQALREHLRSAPPPLEPRQPHGKAAMFGEALTTFLFGPQAAQQVFHHGERQRMQEHEQGVRDWARTGTALEAGAEETRRRLEGEETSGLRRAQTEWYERRPTERAQPPHTIQVGDRIMQYNEDTGRFDIDVGPARTERPGARGSDVTQLADELEAAGMSRADALVEARRRLRSVGQREPREKPPSRALAVQIENRKNRKLADLNREREKRQVEDENPMAREDFIDRAQQIQDEYEAELEAAGFNVSEHQDVRAWPGFGGPGPTRGRPAPTAKPTVRPGRDPLGIF